MSGAVWTFTDVPIVLRSCHTCGVTKAWMRVDVTERSGGVLVTANRAWLRRVWLDLSEPERLAVVAKSVQVGRLPEEVLLELMADQASASNGVERATCAAPGCLEPIPAGSRRSTCDDRCRKRLSRAGGYELVYDGAQVGTSLAALSRSSTSP